MTTITASPTPGAGEVTLTTALSTAQPFDLIQLRGGNYAGTYVLRSANITLEPYPDEVPRLTGPSKFTKDKIAWLRIDPPAAGANIRKLQFVREGDIAQLWQAGWNDYGIVVEAPDVMVEGCTLSGQAKPIHVKGSTSTGGTITGNSIGPMIDSGIALGSSKGVIRGLLITHNDIFGSYREDGIQFMPNYDIPPAEQEKDISNLGVIIVRNDIHHNNENGIDLKGAGLFVIDENSFYCNAGSSDGAPTWNHNSNGTIIRGARTSTGQGIIRNNDCRSNCSGFWLFDQWRIYHNTTQDNNWSPWDTWAGTGISQRGNLPNARLINNLVSGHQHLDLELTDQTINQNNPTTPGPGIELTETVGAGQGRIVTLLDAGLFTDWFGRKELEPDIVYIGAERYSLAAVDYASNTVTLDRDGEWQDGDPVYWRSPEPTVGVLEVYEPEPPDMVEPAELVTISLQTTLPAEQAATVREILSGAAWEVVIN